MQKSYPRGWRKLSPSLIALGILNDPHAAYGILKICIANPKMLYSLRTVNKPSPPVTKF